MSECRQVPRPNQEMSEVEIETKLESVRRAVQYSFPTADVEQMLSEIEQRYCDIALR